jgi:hypothetical protein
MKHVEAAQIPDIENANRARAGSTQLSQFRFEESPDSSVSICVQAAEGKQVGRVTIGIRDVVGA